MNQSVQWNVTWGFDYCSAGGTKQILHNGKRAKELPLQRISVYKAMCLEGGLNNLYKRPQLGGETSTMFF